MSLSSYATLKLQEQPRNNKSTRSNTQVRYKKWKRMMIRRAVALFSRNALRRYMILWTIWRDRCKGVRERAKQFRLRTLQISFRDWARDIVEEKKRLKKKAHLAWAKMQKIRTMKRFEDMMVRHETRERWKHWLYRARRHMNEFRKGAVLRAWKDVVFHMKAERMGDEKATKLQSIWRRIDANKRLVMAAKLRRQYNFEREVKSLEKITNIQTISELRSLISNHEWVRFERIATHITNSNTQTHKQVLVMIYSPWSQGSSHIDEQMKAFSEVAVRKCARGYEFRNWVDNFRLVRLSGNNSQPFLCNVCGCDSSDTVLRRHTVNENNNDGVVYCETCWEKTQRLRVRDRRVVIVREKHSLDEEEEDPWEQCVDETSGCVYYYNTITNESVWERPERKPKKMCNHEKHELDFESGQLLHDSKRTWCFFE